MKKIKQKYIDTYYNIYFKKQEEIKQQKEKELKEWILEKIKNKYITCSKCYQTKHISFFWSNNTTKNKFTTICNDCVSNAYKIKYIQQKLNKYTKLFPKQYQNLVLKWIDDIKIVELFDTYQNYIKK